MTRLSKEIDELEPDAVIARSFNDLVNNSHNNKANLFDCNLKRFISTHSIIETRKQYRKDYRKQYKSNQFKRHELSLRFDSEHTRKILQLHIDTQKKLQKDVNKKDGYWFNLTKDIIKR